MTIAIGDRSEIFDHVLLHGLKFRIHIKGKIVFHLIDQRTIFNQSTDQTIDDIH